MTPDGRTLFLTFPPSFGLPLGNDKLANADATTNLVTDVVPVCANPTLLGMPPLTR